MAAGAEAHALLGIGPVRLPLVVLALELRRIYEQTRWRGFAGQGVKCHTSSMGCHAHACVSVRAGTPTAAVGVAPERHQSTDFAATGGLRPDRRAGSTRHRPCPGRAPFPRRREL